MTDISRLSEIGAADPTTEAFWAGCAKRELLVQHCRSCGAHQFYPRPFCLTCESNDLEWSACGGGGTVYSLTTMRMPVHPDLKPPYLLALVDLDEGPRLLTNIVDGPSVAIGDRVVVAWRDRGDLPPLPVFRPA